MCVCVRACVCVRCYSFWNCGRSFHRRVALRGSAKSTSCDVLKESVSICGNLDVLEGTSAQYANLWRQDSFSGLDLGTWSSMSP